MTVIFDVTCSAALTNLSSWSFVSAPVPHSHTHQPRTHACTQTADDLLARALHALEGAWTHGFDPTTGNVRLDFEVPQNRGLFLTLFRHAQV